MVIPGDCTKAGCFHRPCSSQFWEPGRGGVLWTDVPHLESSGGCQLSCSFSPCTYRRCVCGPLSIHDHYARGRPLVGMGLQGGGINRPGSEGVNSLGPEEPQRPIEARQRCN